MRDDLRKYLYFALQSCINSLKISLEDPITYKNGWYQADIDGALRILDLLKSEDDQKTLDYINERIKFRVRFGIRDISELEALRDASL